MEFLFYGLSCELGDIAQYERSLCNNKAREAVHPRRYLHTVMVDCWHAHVISVLQQMTCVRCMSTVLLQRLHGDLSPRPLAAVAWGSKSPAALGLKSRQQFVRRPGGRDTQ